MMAFFFLTGLPQERQRREHGDRKEANVNAMKKYIYCTLVLQLDQWFCRGRVGHLMALRLAAIPSCLPAGCFYKRVLVV